MTNILLQGARVAAPHIARTAGNVALAYASTAIASLWGGGRAEGPRLSNFRVQTSRDGAPMPRVFGRTRIAGQVIWASAVKETERTERVSSGGGKGGGGSTKLTSFSYSMSFAIGLCEGEISSIGQIWANGDRLLGDGIITRVHKGGQTQDPDSLLQMIDGADMPAFRGTAYVVFEDFPLDDYGGYMPQLSFEVLRQPKNISDTPRLETLLRGVDLIPGSGETVYAPTLTEEVYGSGNTQTLNMNNLQGKPDVELAIDQLEDTLPNCRSVSIVVSWFGNDLRCGQCQLRPGVETRERLLKDQPWRVAGKTRNAAVLISQLDEKPVYGGTPSDSSLIALIKMLRARGFKVSLYPFILMDIPEEKNQPALPWRGRISCDPPDQDQSAEAAAQVDAFFGSCQPSDFTQSGGHVVYSGPNEDSFRRMILHYAALCDLAGGVDSFIIGSEMRGLTTMRGLSHSYPAVAQFTALASDVRALVGAATQITYAADWSEYFGHHKDGDVQFHLDPLWASPDIDAVGIDAYFPLSDWRSEADHLDAALTTSAHDLDYLRANIEGGEGYDWYYASAADRESQTRTLITDGAAQKPWVFAYKDIRNWWSQLHYNRIAGVESATPTLWQAESKPIWLTEIGCPAVDKGANQPNVFYDPKSSESALPYFSSGARDDLIQRRYLEALLTYWDEDGEHNPVSSIYGGAMISTQHMHAWCWDARPFPDFPARQDVWSDGQNWSLGHWLTGRVGVALLSDVVGELASDSGYANPDISALSGIVTGYVIDRPMSARATLEPLAFIYGFDMIEGSGGLEFVMQAGRPAITLTQNELVMEDARGSVRFQDADPESRAQDARLHFISNDSDYQSAMVSIQDDQAKTVKIIDMSAAMVLGRAQASHICARIFERALTGLQTAEFVLAPNALRLRPADYVRLPGVDDTWQIETVQGQTARQVSARRVSLIPAVITPQDIPDVTTSLTLPSAPQIIVLDLPNLTRERVGPLTGLSAVPWRAGVLTAMRDGAGLEELDVTNPVYTGSLLEPLPSAPVGYRDFNTQIRLSLPGVSLSSLEDSIFFAGGNAIALKTDSGWEVLQFQTAQLVDTDQYIVSGFLRGQSGTASFMMDAAPAGSQIVWLGSGLQVLPLPASLRGAQIDLAAYTSGRSGAEEDSFTYQAQQLFPLAPVHASARMQNGELIAQWIRQTRIGADDWASIDVPLSEETERYEIDVYGSDDAVLLTRSVTQPRCVFTANDIATYPELASLPIKIGLYQISAAVGRGQGLIAMVGA